MFGIMKDAQFVEIIDALGMKIAKHVRLIVVHVNGVATDLVTTVKHVVHVKQIAVYAHTVATDLVTTVKHVPLVLLIVGHVLAEYIHRV